MSESIKEDGLKELFDEEKYEDNPEESLSKPEDKPCEDADDKEWEDIEGEDSDAQGDEGDDEEGDEGDDDESDDDDEEYEGGDKQRSEYSKCALMFVDNNGRSELWSAGENYSGLLGQGDQCNQSKKFAPMDYDKENITFSKASIRYSFGLALTDKGVLYGWGANTNHQISLADTEMFFSPTKMDYFNNYYVHDFAVGLKHALVQASPNNDLTKKQLFVIGDYKTVLNKYDVTPEGMASSKELTSSRITWFD